MLKLSPTHDSDLGLLRRYRERRDMDAIATVIDRHQGALLRLAHAVLGDAHAAQDAVQEAFMRLFRDADALVGNPARMGAGEGIGGWLATVVRHECIDQLRRRRPVLSTSEGPATEVVAVAGVPAEPVDGMVWSAVAGLPPIERAAVVLRYRDCASYQDIATALGKTPNHVGVILQQALARLRAVPGLRAMATEGARS